MLRCLSNFINTHPKPYKQWKEIPSYISWRRNIKICDMACTKYNNPDKNIAEIMEKGSLLVGQTLTNYFVFNHVKLYYKYELRPECNNNGQYLFVEHHFTVSQIKDFVENPCRYIDTPHNHMLGSIQLFGS